jgi:hypothetical protein
MLTAFQEKGYERECSLCPCEKQSQFALSGGRRAQPTLQNGWGPPAQNKANFGGRGGFDAGPAMVASRFPATIAKLRLTMPPTERQRRALLNKANLERARLPRRYAPRNDGRRHAAGRGRVRPNIVAALPLVMSSGAKRSRDIWHQKWRTFWSRPDPSTTLGVTERVCSATAYWLNGGAGWGQNLLGFWGEVV